MTQIFYDAVTVGNIPNNPWGVAGYVNGLYANFNEMVARFPNAHHLSIAISVGADADCLDCEPGDATIGEVPAWVDRQLARGVFRPCVYADADYWYNQGLQNELAKYGGNIRRWLAQYDNVAVVPPGFDAKQYKSNGVDVNICLDNFFGPPPPPPDPHHYQWFSTGPFPSPFGNLNERDIVLHYDGARVHPIKYRNYIKNLRKQLQFLANRVYFIAHEQPDKNRKPSWDVDNRGWRYQQLIQRSEGKRLV